MMISLTPISNTIKPRLSSSISCSLRVAPSISLSFNKSYATSSSSSSTPSGGRKRKSKKRPRKSLQWINSEGKFYRETAPYETRYVGRSDQPFPMNPLFRPSAPIKDVTKEQIYKQHISDPKTNTARKLAMKYNISIARVEAILKSKNLERDLLNRGAVLQTDFQAGMERLLCANRLQPITEATSTEATRAEPPYLMTVEENTVFRHQDAIQLLGLPQRKKQSKNKSVAAMTPQERERSRKDAEEENRVVSKDLDEVNRRFKFMFTDTTKGEKNPDVLVRETDGTLRTAQIAEKRLRLDQMQQPRERPLYKQ